MVMMMRRRRTNYKGEKDIRDHPIYNKSEYHNIHLSPFPSSSVPLFVLLFCYTIQARDQSSKVKDLLDCVVPLCAEKSYSVIKFVVRFVCMYILTNIEMNSKLISKMQIKNQYRRVELKTD